MFAAVVVFFVATVAAQDQSLSTQTHPPLPFMDLFTGASNLYSNPIRKTYSDPEYHHGSCQKTDTLTSFANFLTSAAKVMLSAAVIMLLKLLGGKLLLLPIAVMVFVKMGLKALLLWPVITKMIKHFKKKKKRNNSRTIQDCSERLACLIQRSSNSFGSNIGAAVTFSLIDDVDDDHFVAKTLLSILAGDKVAQCMSLDCTSGPDIS